MIDHPSIKLSPFSHIFLVFAFAGIFLLRRLIWANLWGLKHKVFQKKKNVANFFEDSLDSVEKSLY
jgi:hypothetical protein